MSSARLPAPAKLPVEIVAVTAPVVRAATVFACVTVTEPVTVIASLANPTIRLACPCPA